MEGINWDALGSGSEFVGAIGVILTLLYLARQIGHNTVAVKATSLGAVIDSWRVVNRDVILSSPENRRTFYRGMNSYEALNQDEKQVFNLLVAEFVLQLHNVWQLHQRGIVDDVDLKAWTGFTLSVLKTPGGAVHWSITTGYTPTITAYIDRILAESPDHPSLPESMPYFDAKLDDQFDTTATAQA